MSRFIFYRDGAEEKGPFTEEAALKLYNDAEFTSQVHFQIRGSESDENAPFTALKDLIWRNGPSNPFSTELDELDKRIAEKEKELAALRLIAGKKVELEKRVAEIEKKLAEKSKEKGIKPADCAATSKKPAAKAPLQEKISNLEAKFPGLNMKVEAFSMDNELHARTLDGMNGPQSVYVNRSATAPAATPKPDCRTPTQEEMEKLPLCSCAACGLVLANWKQSQMHAASGDCLYQQPLSVEECPDYGRWEAEDDDRLSKGRRIYEGMSGEERGSARPPIDFIDDLHHKLKKDMNTGSDAGMIRSEQFLQSAAAKKINERFTKHLNEAKGNLVCTRCQVACKNSAHFLNHISTYGHRMKVKSSSFELLSLLIGWFNRSAYHAKADESELEDEQMTGDESATVYRLHSEKATKKATPKKDDVLRAQVMEALGSKNTQSCIVCNAIYTNVRQFIVHIGSVQHEENVARVEQSKRKKGEDEEGHDGFLDLFREELQKWRWEDRVKLSCGQKMYSEWSEKEREGAMPREEFVKSVSLKLGETIKKNRQGQYEECEFHSINFNYEEFFEVAEVYLTTKKAADLMMRLYSHLGGAKRLACAPCKFGCTDIETYLIHCMTYEHVRVTQGTVYELATALIGVHNKSLYV